MLKIVPKATKHPPAHPTPANQSGGAKITRMLHDAKKTEGPSVCICAAKEESGKSPQVPRMSPNTVAAAFNQHGMSMHTAKDSVLAV